MPDQVALILSTTVCPCWGCHRRKTKPVTKRVEPFVCDLHWELLAGPRREGFRKAGYPAIGVQPLIDALNAATIWRRTPRPGLPIVMHIPAIVTQIGIRQTVCGNTIKDPQLGPLGAFMLRAVCAAVYHPRAVNCHACESGIQATDVPDVPVIGADVVLAVLNDITASS